MKCNNIHCIWNYKEMCCPESEEIFKGAVPNTLDCPTSTRKDIDQQIWNIHDECVSLLKKRNMKELIAILKFIVRQRL